MQSIGSVTRWESGFPPELRQTLPKRFSIDDVASAEKNARDSLEWRGRDKGNSVRRSQVFYVFYIRRRNQTSPRQL